MLKKTGDLVSSTSGNINEKLDSLSAAIKLLSYKIENINKVGNSTTNKFFSENEDINQEIENYRKQLPQFWKSFRQITRYIYQFTGASLGTEFGINSGLNGTLKTVSGGAIGGGSYDFIQYWTDYLFL